MKEFLKISLLLILFTFAFMPQVSFAGYVSDWCDEPKCTEAKVGPFLQDISAECANTGRCKLDDLMILVHNVGNFVLKIVGAFLLFFYVYGGFWYLVSHGDDGYVKKGKTAMKTATIGFIYIILAYSGIQILYKALTDKPVPGSSSSSVVIKCDAKDASGNLPTDGTPCGTAKKCDGKGKCVSLCIAPKVCKKMPIDKVDPKTCTASSGLCAEGSYCCDK